MAFSPDSYIGTFAPKKMDLKKPELTRDDRAFITFCERLEGEGKAYPKELGIDKQIVRAWEMVEGKHFTPRKHKEHRARVAANLTLAYLERKSSMLTDAMPELNVRSRTGNESTATVMQDAIKGIWTEKDVQDTLLRAIVTAAVTGRAMVGCDWDTSLDFGNGDLFFPLFQWDECIIDPYLRNISALQDDAEYVVTSQVMPLTKIHELFPGRGRLVKPDSGLSRFKNSRPDLESESSYVYHRPSREQGSSMVNSVVPRALLKRAYFRDRTRDPDTPESEEGLPNYLFPRKRMMIWAGEIPLYDGNQKNWDGLFPVEGLDWGIEPRHQYGTSEVKATTSLQLAFDVLLSGVIDNARLINDPPWLMDEDAVRVSVLQEIRRYGDRMGWPILKRPRSDIQRNPPGQLSNVTFSTLQMIQQLLEIITGVVDVVQGRQPGQVESGVAIQSLQIAMQVTIRRQARQVESFLTRLGRLMISRVIQYYTSERLFHSTDEWGKTSEFVWRRGEFIKALMKKITLSKGGSEEEHIREVDRALQNAFKDTVLSVVPMSGLPESVGAKINIMTTFADKRWASPEEAMKAARISEPDVLMKKADEYQKSQAILGAEIQQILAGGGGAQMPPSGGNGRQVPVPQKSEIVPTMQRSAPGGQAPASETGE